VGNDGAKVPWRSQLIWGAGWREDFKSGKGRGYINALLGTSCFRNSTSSGGTGPIGQMEVRKGAMSRRAA